MTPESLQIAKFLPNKFDFSKPKSIIRVNMKEKLAELGSQEQWFGQPAPEVVRKIVEVNPQISRIAVVQYCSWGDSDEKEISEWWETVHRMSRKDVLNSLLYIAIAGVLNLGDEEESIGWRGLAVSVSSKVELDSGKEAQIPMLDFTIWPTSKNLLILKDKLLELNFPPGFIINSGNSYHYWGTQLLGPRKWLSWLKSVSSKESPILGMVDSKWVKRSQDERCGYLRIAPSDSKRQPKVEALI